MQTDRRQTDRRRGERRQPERRKGERRRDTELRNFLALLKRSAERRGHRLREFEVVSASGGVVVRSTCAFCGEWVRAYRSGPSSDSMGPALRKDCHSPA